MRSALLLASSASAKKSSSDRRLPKVIAISRVVRGQTLEEVVLSGEPLRTITRKWMAVPSGELKFVGACSRAKANPPSNSGGVPSTCAKIMSKEQPCNDSAQGM